MKLLVLTPDYPDDRRSIFPFVKQLVDEIALKGNDVQIIAPYSLTHNRRFIKQIETMHVGEGSITIYRPYYVSFSNLRIRNKRLSDITFENAVRRGFKMLKKTPDVVYGHFWYSAYLGFNYAKKNHLPLFVATGESSIKDQFNPSKGITEFCSYLSGVICVSTKNKEESVKLGLTSAEKCIVIPNAINNKVFKKKDSKECRKQLGLPASSFIISFVGWFNDRKGSKRLSDAIEEINDKTPIYSIFIGEGNKEPQCDNILFKGVLNHEKIVDYLNAADVFVLPTLREGCCNAIIEAMACGLPVISSDLPFNYDILNNSNSILIDPNNVCEIANAIKTLKDEITLREKLSIGALITANKLTIEKRARRILQFIYDKTS